MRRRVVALLALVALALVVGSAPADAFAQERKSDSGKRPPPVDAMTGKRMNEAIEALNAEKYGEAQAILSKLKLDKLSPYERSRVEQILASIAHVQGEEDLARQHLEKAIASGGLNDQEISSARFNIAQLYMSEERWKEGAAALQVWFQSAENPNSAAYYMLAAAYYQLDDTSAALVPAQKAVDLSDTPQESWLQLLLALRLRREEYKQALPILHKLIAVAPGTKSYWVQLSSIAGQLGEYEEAVVPLQIAYRAGLLTEDGEIRRLADLLLFVGLPYRGAQLLSEAIDQNKVKVDARVQETLGNCYVAAREFGKAIKPLERAAELSDSGNIYVRVAEVYVQREEWPAAANALRKGIQKGKLTNAGNANLLMGIALFSQKELKAAAEYFERARQFSAYRQQADSWLRAIETGQGA